MPGQDAYQSPDTFEQSTAEQTLQTDPATQGIYAFVDGNPTTSLEVDGHTAVPCDPDAGNTTSSCGKVRLFAHPSRPASFLAGGDLQLAQGCGAGSRADCSTYQEGAAQAGPSKAQDLIDALADAGRGGEQLAIQLATDAALANAFTDQRCQIDLCQPGQRSADDSRLYSATLTGMQLSKVALEGATTDSLTSEDGDLLAVLAPVTGLARDLAATGGLSAAKDLIEGLVGAGSNGVEPDVTAKLIEAGGDIVDSLGVPHISVASAFLQKLYEAGGIEAVQNGIALAAEELVGEPQFAESLSQDLRYRLTLLMAEH